MKNSNTIILNFQWTPSLLKNHQNTYVFAKSLAEMLIIKDAKDLPIAIVRPSISELFKSEKYNH